MALVGGLMLAMPARAAVTIGSYLSAVEALDRVGAMPTADRIAYMAGHADELDRATRVLEQAAMAFETVLRTNEASGQLYGRYLLCNWDDESAPDAVALVRGYLRRAQAARHLSDTEVRATLYDVDFAEMLTRELVQAYQCPADLTPRPMTANVPVAPAPPTLPRR